MLFPLPLVSAFARCKCWADQNVDSAARMSWGRIHLFFFYPEGMKRITISKGEDGKRGAKKCRLFMFVFPPRPPSRSKPCVYFYARARHLHVLLNRPPWSTRVRSADRKARVRRSGGATFSASFDSFCRVIRGS